MKRNSEAMTRRHIWIEDDTWEQLHEIFGETIGPSKAVREILKTYISTLNSRAQQKGRALPPISPEDLE